uniref:PDZ domain-containing protein n=1 Tax=Phaeomonas parva TaxID=124430 RepID=A0A6U4EGF8_9STRA|mmetsp:Transcript_20103/g.60990  ORF Transcript_20103/g.60990 Transcript_20103/m.60990 type:complete len:167 (+) Transcript_20103:139-639(+)
MFKAVLCLLALGLARGLVAPRAPLRAGTGVRRSRIGELNMNDPLTNFFRAKRGVAAGDRIVEIKKPLGLVLEEDERGDVYVASVAGNAARTGKVNVGDQVVMCSATFGDEMWSTRGSGLYSVMNAVKVRATLKALDNIIKAKQRSRTPTPRTPTYPNLPYRPMPTA